MDFEKRLSNLEKLVNSLSKKIDNIKFYSDADINGCRSSEDRLLEKNTEQDTGISENDLAICEVAEMSDVNSMAIDDIAEMLDDLESRISEMEVN